MKKAGVKKEEGEMEERSPEEILREGFEAGQITPREYLRGLVDINRRKFETLQGELQDWLAACRAAAEEIEIPEPSREVLTQAFEHGTEIGEEIRRLLERFVADLAVFTRS